MSGMPRSTRKNRYFRQKTAAIGKGYAIGLKFAAFLTRAEIISGLEILTFPLVLTGLFVEKFCPGLQYEVRKKPEMPRV